MKKIKADLPKRVNAALNVQALAAEAWANQMRLLFAVICAGLAVWYWPFAYPAKFIYLGLAAAWIGVLIVAVARRRQDNAESLINSSAMIDVTVINLGLVAFGALNLFHYGGAGLYFFYFPVLVIAAARHRFLLPVKVGIYATVVYSMVALFSGSNPWLRMVVLLAVTLIAAAIAGRTKALLQNFTTEVAQEAYETGRRDREVEMAVLLHEAFMSPAICDLESLWLSAKHLAGTETSGDYYHVFDFSGEPLLVVGDLPGKGLEAAPEVAQLHRKLTQIVQRETALPVILKELNAYVLEEHRGRKQFRCFIGRWAGEQLSYINAGLPPTIQIGRQDQKLLPVNSVAVGAQSDAMFTENTVPFPARDLLLVYTDGLYQGLTEDEDKGVAEIEKLAEQFKTGEVNTLCHRVFDCAHPGLDAPGDDRTLVVVRRQASAVAASAEGRAPVA
jgi:serine phosphatase RsbU (regulator of sigma subunit)